MISQSTQSAFVLAIPRPAWAAFALTALAGGASAQASDAEIRADIEFARGLASEWSFVDLASEVIDDARKKGPSGQLREALDLASCEVFSEGARVERDDARRNELFIQALDQYEAFLNQHPSSDLAPTAETGLVNTAVFYGQSVDIALESLAGEAAEELKKTKIDVLEQAVGRTADLIEAITEKPVGELQPQEKIDGANLMLARGRMLADIGHASDGGEYFFEQAIASLEDMVFYFGEGGSESLRAYQALGSTFQKRGDSESAFYMYEGVLNQTWPADEGDLKRMIDDADEAGVPIEDEEWAYRYLFLEIAMRGLLETSIDLGAGDQACALAMHYYNCRQEKGLTWSAPAGYDSLLACAEVLLDAGGFIGGNQTTGEAKWFATEDEMKEAVRSKRHHETATSFALKLANIVNTNNKGNFLQVKAQKLISDIASRPGVVVSIEVLIQAAEGEYYDGNDAEAIEAFKRVLAALELKDSAERLEHIAKIYHLLGRCYARQGRNFEAAVAYEAGLDANDLDVDFTKDNAKGLRFAAKANLTAAPDDETLKAAAAHADERYLQVADDDGAGSINYRNGLTAMGEREWDEAIGHFSKIPIEDNFGERAKMDIAVCHVRAKRPSQALELIEEYIEWVPNNPVESPTRKQKRLEALATAEFYRGFIHYSWAKAKAKGGTEDPTSDWTKAEEYLTGFPDRHPQQAQLAPLSLRLLIDARLALGDRTGARECFDRLIADHRHSDHTGKSALTYYNTLRSMREAADEAESLVLLGEMAELLKVTNSIMAPAYDRLLNERLHWVELGNFEEAERAILVMIDEFADDPKRAESIRTHVMPALGGVLLENHKIAEAKEVLAPLMLDPDSNPSKTTIINFTKAISGWLTGGGDGGAVQEVPGAGGTEEEWQAALDSMHMLAQRDKWSCQWYEYKLMHLYTYYAWGKQDSRKLDNGKSQFVAFASNFENDDFSPIGEICEEADPALKARTGGGVLQDRMEYLARKLR